MTDLPEGLSPHARALASWFVAAGRTTFTLKEHLWAAAAAVSPGSSGTGERRRILSETLRELAAANVVQLSGSDRERCPLPTRVRLPHAAPSVPRARPDPWHPDMARMTVSGTGEPRPPHTTLGRINGWVIRHRRAAVPEPRQERALEVTGNEKAFDRLGPEIDPDAFDRVTVTYRVDVPLLPPIRPATGLYTLLLAHGTRAEHTAVEPDRARELVDWLDPEHRDAAAALLAGGGRFAQEACRRRLLAGDDTWRACPDGA